MFLTIFYRIWQYFIARFDFLPAYIDNRRTPPPPSTMSSPNARAMGRSGLVPRRSSPRFKLSVAMSQGGLAMREGLPLWRLQHRAAARGGK